MSSSNSSRCLSLVKQGFWPGPYETEALFIRRCTYCLNLQQALEKEASLFQDWAKKSKPVEEVSPEGLARFESFYDCAPTWVKVIFSNEKLSLWQGGCAWIFQLTEDAPRAALLQLRAHYSHSKTYLKLYPKEELIAHELSHICRMAYDEPRFEEILAYRTSPSSFRRYFGGILRSSTESMGLFILLLFWIAIQGYAFISEDEAANVIASWTQLFVLGATVFGIARLWRRQTQLTRCLSHLEKALPNPHQANAVLYRLTDREIILFSHSRPSKIKEYVEENASRDFRLQLLKELYFNPNNSYK